MSLLFGVSGIFIPVMARKLMQEDVLATSLSSFIAPILILCVLIIVMTVSSYVNMKWGHVLGTRMETDMRRDLFGHLQKLSFSYFDNTKTGHIMSRISNDLFTISEIAHHSPEDLFMASIMIFGGFGFMFYFSVPLAILCLIPLPVMFIWGISFGGKMRKGFRGVRKKVADINSNVENSIQGIREVQSFTNEDHEIRKFHDVNKEFRVAKERMYTTMAGFHAGMQFFMQMYTVILIGGGSILIMYGKTTLPDLVAFLLYQRFIIRPIQNLINFVEQYQQGVASFERFTEIMDIDPDITDAEDAVDIEGEIQGFVKLDNVRFRYKEDSEDALHNIFEKIFDLLVKNEIEKFDAWLYSVTKNYCLMQLRKKQKIQTYSIDDGIVSGENQVEENTEDKYFSLLRKHLTKLKEEQALCLELFYFEKKSYKDIALLTSLDVKDIKSHIQNGKRMLKNLFLKEENYK